AGFPNANVLSVFDSAFNTQRITPGFDFVSNNNQLYDDNSHGTYVLSCMASEVPGQVVGTAPKASYLLIRTEDAPTEYIIEEYYWVAGAEFADSAGANIITSSLGYTTFDDSSQDHTYQDMDGKHTIAARGADIAASKGIFVNISAGNSGNSSWHYISTPADADSALAVGAVDENGIVAAFSSRGPAPNGAVKPNVMAMGKDATVVDPSGTVTTGSGTSFAGPINAGAVACLWQAYPQANNMRLIDAIQRSGNYYSNPNGDYGYGIPNYCLALQILTGNDPRNQSENYLEITPNPFKENFNIKLYTKDTQTIIVYVFDVSGKIIFSTTQKLTANSYNIIPCNVPEQLSDGAYSIWIKSDRLNERKKILKLSAY
ncbi:MAG: S8 family peptidase, partial [Bacteroidia bacterium]|nr:S8 family peptidase [Bacteroidia bacterium]